MFTPNRAPGYLDNVRNAESLRKVPSFDPESKSMMSYPPYFEQYPPMYNPRMNMEYSQGYIGGIEYESSEDFPSLLTSKPPGFSNEDFYPPPGFSKPLKTKAPNPNAVSFIPSYLTSTPVRDEKEEQDAIEYGLRGALPLQKNFQEDKKMMANGKDLSVELNKKNHEKLCSYFHSPFSDKEIENVESPEFTLPQSYYISKPILKQKMVKQYQDGTLFYIFYSMPGEILQSIAAELLYQRNWVYDPIKQAWFSSVNSEWRTFDINRFEIVSTQTQTGPFLAKDEVALKLRT